MRKGTDTVTDPDLWDKIKKTTIWSYTYSMYGIMYSQSVFITK